MAKNLRQAHNELVSTLALMAVPPEEPAYNTAFTVAAGIRPKTDRKTDVLAYIEVANKVFGIMVANALASLHPEREEQ